MIHIYSLMLYLDGIMTEDDIKGLILIFICNNSMNIKFRNYVLKIERNGNDYNFTFRKKKTLIYDRFTLSIEEFKSFKRDLFEIYIYESRRSINNF